MKTEQELERLAEEIYWHMERGETSQAVAKLKSLQITGPDLKAICQAYAELNIIRARDGVPYDCNGTRCSVTQEHWDSVMDALETIVRRETSHGCWQNPIMFDVYHENHAAS